METRNDEYYIREILHGTTSSFSFLVEKYKDMAFYLALRVLNNTEEAEEAAQDAFIKAFKSLRNFKGQSSFKTWFFRIVYNTSISRLRSNNRRNEVTVDTEINDRQMIDTESTMNRLKKEERQRYLEMALTKLSPNERALLSMYYYEDFPVDEIGRITNLTVSNVKVKLHRSRKKLFQLLNDILKEEIISIL